MQVDFQQALHASELASLAAFMRAVLGHAIEEGDNVVSLRVTCTHTPGDPGGRAVVEAEVIDRSGAAVAGFSL